MAAQASSGVPAPASNDFAGLTDRGIVEHIAATCRPAQVLDKDYGQGGLWEALSSIALRDDGSLTDWMSDSHDYRPDRFDKTRPVAGLMIGMVVPQSWWGDDSMHGQMPGRDLLNLIISNTAAEPYRSDYSPWPVEMTDYDNGFWKSGRSMFYGVAVNCYEPADCYKGDFARAIMYMACVYPMQLWRSHAYLLMADGSGYPALSSAGAELLMKWHRDDPVSDIEIRRNDVAYACQQNRNPFVDMPVLAEYVWGTMRGSEVPDPAPDDPEARDPVPLKASYSIEADRQLDLFYPSVPDNARWMVDGRDVDALSLNLDELGVGRHELRYRAEQSCGKLIVTVTP